MKYYLIRHTVSHTERTLHYNYIRTHIYTHVCVYMYTYKYRIQTKENEQIRRETRISGFAFTHLFDSSRVSCAMRIFFMVPLFFFNDLCVCVFFSSFIFHFMHFHFISIFCPFIVTILF